ncbi:MAG: Franean1_4349 family RiPP [Anaerolineae bacterium]|nr:Franean1_4349 family RiPP [Anaerolineae bacterium]
MASREQLERLVGQALLDVGFRRRLLGDPQGAAKEVGAHLTEGQLDRIRQWDAKALDALAGPFEDWLAWLIQWLISHFGRGW